jgi:hypothetical protein
MVNDRISDDGESCECKTLLCGACFEWKYSIYEYAKQMSHSFFPLCITKIE